MSKEPNEIVEWLKQLVESRNGDSSDVLNRARLSTRLDGHDGEIADLKNGIANLDSKMDRNQQTILNKIDSTLAKTPQTTSNLLQLLGMLVVFLIAMAAGYYGIYKSDRETDKTNAAKLLDLSEKHTREVIEITDLDRKREIDREHENNVREMDRLNNWYKDLVGIQSQELTYHRTVGGAQLSPAAADAMLKGQVPIGPSPKSVP